MTTPLPAQKALHSRSLDLTALRQAAIDTAFPVLCRSAMERVDTLLEKGFRRAKRFRTTVRDSRGRLYAIWLTDYRGTPITVVFSWQPATGDCQSEVAYSDDTFDTLMLLHSVRSTRDDPRNLYATDSTRGLPILDGGVRPRVLQFPEPQYPPPLQTRGIGGRVVLDFVVDTTGLVEPTSIQVVASSHLLFEPVALGAARGAVFSPGQVDGRPVRVLVRQTIIFSAP
jgi:TonB family protein